MIKKNLLLLMCVVASLMSLTSCFKDTGFSQTMDFARVVTIDRNATPLKLVADYTGQTFQLDNLTRPEQLSIYGLENADRAIVALHYEVDAEFNASMVITGGKPIKVAPVWNKPLPKTEDINPLIDLYKMELDSWSYPLIWTAGKYLNVAPVIHSAGLGTYYLEPVDVYGDTLRFDMTAEYKLNTENKDLVDFINFDLSTLADTVGADAKSKSAVERMLGTIESNDSVCIMLVGSYLTTGRLGNDTIVKWPIYTSYTGALKSIF